ncbi:MAG: hypothetical protein ACK56F_00375 [bacterium]
MGNTRHGETTIVADPGNALAAGEDDGEFTGPVTDFDLHCRNAGTRLHGHPSNLAAYVDALTNRHGGQ